MIYGCTYWTLSLKNAQKAKTFELNRFDTNEIVNKRRKKKKLLKVTE